MIFSVLFLQFFDLFDQIFIRYCDFSYKYMFLRFLMYQNHAQILVTGQPQLVSLVHNNADDPTFENFKESYSQGLQEIQSSYSKMSQIFVISVRNYTFLQTFSRFGVSHQNQIFSTKISGQNSTKNSTFTKLTENLQGSVISDADNEYLTHFLIT